MARPKSSLQPSTIREIDGRELSLPRYDRHFLSDEEGFYLNDLNDWEDAILRAELSRIDNVTWYRNPDRPSQDSLRITYNADNEIKILRPDFIFLQRI